MITSLTNANVDEVLNTTKPVVIDVYATWCGPCIQMKPHFKKLAEELGKTYLFADVNIDQAREIATRFNVTSVPTLVFMKNKEEVGRKVGYLNEEDLRAAIEEFLG